MSLLRLIFVAGGFALGAYYAARHAGKTTMKHPGKTVKDQVATWENEGGYAPNVATPRPAPGSSYVRGTQ